MNGDTSQPKNWTVKIEIDEHSGRTRATARLRYRDRDAVGVGYARVNPADRDIADIGDELAVGRALSDLARQLMAVTAAHIEAVTRQPVARLS